jgi:hypothetical protein
MLDPRDDMVAAIRQLEARLGVRAARDGVGRFLAGIVVLGDERLAGLGLELSDRDRMELIAWVMVLWGDRP